MSVRNRFLFFLVAWLIVLMPFLFWWNTWFGRRLSDQQLTQYLNDEKHPRHIQHALVQLSDRIRQGDSGSTRWYPEIVRLASSSVDEVRNTDAWVMGQDTSAVAFHQTLRKMLGDSSALVRGNAALSLVRFGDASGRPQILELLQPAKVVAPAAGSVTDSSTVGTTVRQGGLIAKLRVDGQMNTGQKVGAQSVEVRSPITGRIRTLSAPLNARLTAGAEMASVDPGDDQVWEALRALYLIGQLEDLPAIQPYERDSPQISDRVRQQAALTEKSIHERAIRP
jgi:HEAT repeat protein